MVSCDAHSFVFIVPLLQLSNHSTICMKCHFDKFKDLLHFFECYTRSTFSSKVHWTKQHLVSTYSTRVFTETLKTWWGRPLEGSRIQVSFVLHRAISTQIHSSDNLYEIFLFLHAALSLSANNHSCCYVDYTRALLKHNVNTFSYCCGKSHASFNVHCQLH